MKKSIVLFLICALTLTSCSEDKEDKIVHANITFNFEHSWDISSVTNSDFNSIQYTNGNGEQLSITKLRYLISKIKFESSNGDIFIMDGYNLVDVTNNTNVTFTPTTTLPTGSYSNVSFLFGFDNDDNYQNYQDLNSASWIVPEMLGSGYHFMQLEGKFIDDTATEKGYAYHAIRAVDNSGSTLVFEDTFFEFDLGAVIISNDTTFNVNMDISEWFKNPNTWDLNVLNNMLMPNFDAQVMMFENGKNVFSLESINQ